MTIAARTDSGRFANNGARTTAVARIRPDVISDDTWVRLPAASPVADWLQARVDGEPAEQPGSGVGDAEADEFLVRIDLVAVTGRERAGRPDRLGEGQEDDPEGAGDEEDDVAELDVREARDRDRR